MWSAEVLIEMLARLNHALTNNIRVMFVGGGDGIETLKEMSQRHNLEDKVTFVGAVPHCDVPAYLSASDIFWFVMKDPLPIYGLALQEAMSCENVVVANNSGSMKELIRSGYNGFLVEPSIDEMSQGLITILSKNSKELERVRKAARKDAVEMYSWEVNLPKISDVLDGISGREKIMP